MPREVYIVPEVNAWVGQRGGIMGLGSRRVMGLGLPLLQIMTVNQLKAVVAHEFGHYHQGDTKLGPWVYKTRSTIGRTLAGLEDSILQKPFMWYGELFLKITAAVSRRQEFVADELAARTTSPSAIRTALESLYRHGPAFNTYWRTEVEPVLHSGFYPPLAEGFGEYTHAELIANSTANILERALHEESTQTYDSHPSLSERLAALAEIPETKTEDGNQSAMSLMQHVGEVEKSLLAFITGDELIAKFQPIRWDEVGTKMYLPGWETLARRSAAELRTIHPGNLVEIIHDGPRLRKILDHPDKDKMSFKEQDTYILNILAATMGYILARKGWQLHADVGEPTYFTLADAKIELFQSIHQFYANELSAQQWNELIAATGITDDDFQNLPGPVEQPTAVDPVINS